MPTHLVLLGTAGGPTPKVARSAPAQAVLVDGHAYLIDAGNGVARQLALAGIPPRSLDTILLTHHHSDHNADVGTVLLLSWAANLDHDVRVYGPPPIRAMIRQFLDLHEPDIGIRIADEGRPDLRRMISTHDVTQPGPVYADERVRITAALVNHPPFVTALAYRIDTADRSIVISGDTTPCPALIALARDADILVHEVIHLPSIEWIGTQSNGATVREHLRASHTSVDQVGAIAAAAHVGTLVLSHYVPTDSPLTDQQWVKMASVGFNGPVIAGRDLMVL